MTISPSGNIQVKEGTHIAKSVLMPGDPLRAKFIAETYLEDPVLFNDVRNMLGYTGTFHGKEVSVMGSGMGIPSIMLYAHELYNFFGVETIIRVGSTGALIDDIKLKDIIIAITASTDSSCMQQYGIFETLSPCVDPLLFETVMGVANWHDISVRVGSVYSSDYFYHPDPCINMRLKKMNHLAVEMETAGLYLTAMRNNKKALTILSVSNKIFTGEHLSPLEICTGFDDMMLLALNTAIKI